MDKNTFWVMRYRKQIMWAYAFLTLGALLSLTQIKFAFQFEQFFPQGDPDLAFFQEFIKDFETDDNFLLVAVESEGNAFSQEFLEDLHSFADSCKQLPYVTSVQSLINLTVPSFSPFGLKFSPFLRSSPDSLRLMDSLKIVSNPRYVDNFLSKDKKAMLLVIKHDDNIGMAQSAELMEAFNKLWSQSDFPEYALLGRAYFQDELSRMQQREVMVSGFVSILLVSIIFYFLYRQKYLILVSLATIALGMLLFVGGLSLFGREFNAISALYPVLMLIVGTSDVVHIVSKYVDLIMEGKGKSEALQTTVSQIGTATFLTSFTTAVGFLSLMSSRIVPIKDFGVNSAAGVLLAYVIVITFTLAAISYVPRESIKATKFQSFWSRMMERCYQITRDNTKQILAVLALLIVVFGVGISKISTNYNIESNLPRNAKLTRDFLYFEDQFSGFRPFEFAIQIKNGKQVYEGDVLHEVDKLASYIDSYDEVGAVQSLPDIYKNINQAMQGGGDEYYVLPADTLIDRYRTMVSKMGMPAVLVSRDMTKTRITSKVNDEGADNIKMLGLEIDTWIVANIDTTLLDVKRTGTGVILDKNAEYVRESLLYGLLMALGVIGLVMVLLFKDIKMLFISLIPNVLPLAFAAAMLGYFGIELEATISIIFTIVFGIAVDDTIHFLSKYKLSRSAGHDKEEAILRTFKDTGKAIVFTTIILFFGFLVLLFSVHPPSNTIGILISLTLVSALLADFFVLPMLLRKFM